MSFWPLDLKDWVGVIKDIITLLAIITGGIWALWKFNIFGEKYSKMELSFEIVHLGDTPECHLIELQGEVANRGLRSQTLYDLGIEIFGYSEIDSIPLNIDNEVKFPFKIQKKVFKNGSETVDGGTAIKLTYLAAIDVSIDWVSVIAQYSLTKKKSAGKKDKRDMVVLRKTRRLTGA